MTIKVVKISRISPSTTISLIEPFIIPLTYLDLRWVRSHPTQQAIFYKLSHSSPEVFHSIILPRLELSLSHALHHYLPLTGRLTWNSQDPKPIIVVSKDDTVSLTVAESDVDFSFISGKGLRQQSELRVLVPELSVSSDSSDLYSLQITLFPNQGFCIGLAEHHVVKDGNGSIMFLKSWALICKSLEHGRTMTLPLDLTPIIDPSLINVPVGLESKILESMSYFSEDGKRTLKPPPIGDINTDLVRITLDLTQDKVEKLKDQVKRESTRYESELHLSTFVVVTAYVWSCLVKACAGDSEERPVLFMYAADFRNRLDPLVPERYFGNCIVLTGCYGHKAKVLLGREGFINAVEILGDSVKGLGSRGIEEHFELYIDGMKQVKPETYVESVSGSNKTGVYGSDFGWGKPVNHEIVSIDRYDGFTMSERRDEIGGAEIGLCLKKSEMETFISLFNNGFEIIVSRI